MTGTESLIETETEQALVIVVIAMIVMIAVIVMFVIVATVIVMRTAVILIAITVIVTMTETMVEEAMTILDSTAMMTAMTTVGHVIAMMIVFHVTAMTTVGHVIAMMIVFHVTATTTVVQMTGTKEQFGKAETMKEAV